eukprot:scaffold67524_cov31-Tisochrysis_lutea.AAC.1
MRTLCNWEYGPLHRAAGRCCTQTTQVKARMNMSPQALYLVETLAKPGGGRAGDRSASACACAIMAAACGLVPKPKT